MERTAIVEIMEIPEGVPPLLGYIALEMLDFVIHPQRERLIGNPDHGGELIIDML